MLISLQYSLYKALRKMQYKQYPLVLFATTLLLALTQRASFAFGLTPQPQPSASSFYQSQLGYQMADGSGTGIVRVTTPISLAAGATLGFKKTLKNAFPSWNITYATQDLNGTFNIDLYYPSFEPNIQQVGGSIKLDYNAGLDDPQSGRFRLKWIQMVTRQDNTGLKTSFIDIADFQPTPFYPGPSTETTFTDGSTGIPQLTSAFYGQLFLVERTAPKTVTIYNGVLWGWRNVFTPSPPPPPTPPSGSGGGGFRIANLSLNRELPFFNTDSNDTPQISNSSCGWQ